MPCSYCRNPDGGTSPWCCTEIECVGNTPGETWDFCDVCAPPPPQPPSPSPPPPSPSPPPPPPPTAQYVGSVSELVTAIRNDSVDLVVVRTGTYIYNTSSMAEMCTGTAICINRNLTIKAEMPGAVVLNAMDETRVFKIQSGGTAELIGLNITGGRTSWVRSVLGF